EVGASVFARDYSTIGDLGFPIYHYKHWYLPVSVIALPLDHTAAIWTYCSLYHEVGHLLNHDLDLYPTLRTPLRKRLLTGGTSEYHCRVWDKWLTEMIADTFGILLGGAGF